jgi:hypothetical protein
MSIEPPEGIPAIMTLKLQFKQFTLSILVSGILMVLFGIQRGIRR